MPIIWPWGGFGVALGGLRRLASIPAFCFCWSVASGGFCLGSHARGFPGHELRGAMELHLLHKLLGFNVLHTLTGHDRGREGRGCRERTTGYKCLCRNELRVGKAGGGAGFASLRAGDPAKRVQAGSLGSENV